jgi:tetratricopeptide (TPR) repeat protein
VRALLAAALGQGPAAPARFTGRFCGLIVPCDKDKNPYGIKSERESLADAERHFTRAIALDAQMTEAYVRLAHVRARLGRHDDALAVLSKLPPSGDDNVAFYAALIEGKALEGLGRLDEALAAYQRGRDLFPDAQSANIALSGVEQRRGEASRAVAFARRAVDPHDDERQSLDPFAAYIFGRGRSSAGAWEAFISALEKSP